MVPKMGQERQLLLATVFVLLTFICGVFPCKIPESERFSCGQYMTQEQCEANNCCYSEKAPFCYFPTKDGAGGPIQHANGLCLYPKAHTTGRLHYGPRFLVWSNDCSSRSAIFVVARNYSTYHSDSGRYLALPSIEVILTTTRTKHKKYGPVENGNLEYKNGSGKTGLCVGGGRESSLGFGPREGRPVISSKSACNSQINCKSLTYVLQRRLKMKTEISKRIKCPSNYTIEMTWANYGLYVVKNRVIPLPLQFTNITTCVNNATMVMREKCDGRTSCTVRVSDDTFLRSPGCYNNVDEDRYLVVRYRCKPYTKPAVFTAKVLGQTNLQVKWSFGEVKPAGNMQLCWGTQGHYFKTCVPIQTNSNQKDLDNLQPGTLYFITMVPCYGIRNVNWHSQISKITRTGPLNATDIQTHQFEIEYKTLQENDRYVQIIIKKQNTKEAPTLDPDSYTSSALQPKNAATDDQPYIAAEITKEDVIKNKTFTVGDGRKYNSMAESKNGRNTEFHNVKLQPNSYYFVFQRTFKNQNLSYNTEWSGPVKTYTNDRDPKKIPKNTVEKDSSSDNLVTISLAVAGTVAGIIVLTFIAFLILRRRAQADRVSRQEEIQVVYAVPSDPKENKDNHGGSQENLVQDINDQKESSSFVSHIQCASGDLYARPQKSKESQNQVNPYLNEGNDKGDSDDDFDDDFDDEFDNEIDSINVSRFLMHVEDMKKNNNAGFQQEYEKLSVNQLHPWDNAKKTVNLDKNRYGNIVTYDHSRVVLSGEEDYINASYIHGIEPDIYIASQGPNPVTVNDFWRMIWEQDNKCIICLTRVSEIGKIKCCQYWPERQRRPFGDIKVTVVHTEMFADYAIRLIEMEKDDEKKKVTQYHYRSWPDHDAPRCPTQLLTFRQRVKALHSGGKEPIVVHCSAGAGRTGTFIALDMILESLNRLGDKTIDVFNIVEEIRGQRINMVQTVEQYIFLHEAILESILCGVTEIEARNVRIEIERLEQKGRNKSLSGFAIEFKKLNSICPTFSPEECEEALKEENRGKNRAPNINPCESFRVSLSRIKEISSSTYINATFVDGYSKRQAYIATQTPLDDTVDDFWRMVYEKEATVIVMLNNLDEGKKVYPQYWPSELNHEVQYGNLMVKMMSSFTKGSIITRKFSIASHNQNVPNEHVVRHVQFTTWPDKGVPSNIADVMELLKTVEVQQQRTSDGLVIVHCSNGAHRTGAYLTLDIQRERMKTEHVIDIFRCIKILRAQRPQFVGNLEQYKFCYQAMLSFIETFDTYDNLAKLTRN